MKIKEIGIWIGVAFVFAAISWGLIVLVNNTGTPNSASQNSEIKTPAHISKNDITLGSVNAKATLIEYADFQCPACKVYSGLVKQLNKDFSSNLLIVYRFLPLTGHKNALTSAQAAYAAFKQSKFWEMDGLLYENQDSWAEADDPQAIFADYAKKLNLDVSQFAIDYNSESTKQFINAQKGEGFSLGLVYAPSLFVNGKLISNPQNYDAFKQIIQNALNNK